MAFGSETYPVPTATDSHFVHSFHMWCTLNMLCTQYLITWLLEFLVFCSTTALSSAIVQHSFHSNVRSEQILCNTHRKDKPYRQQFHYRAADDVLFYLSLILSDVLSDALFAQHSTQSFSAINSNFSDGRPLTQWLRR